MAGRITKRTVDALKPGDIVWDSGLSGFGVRRQADAVAYFVRYRAGRGRTAAKRYMSIGIHGTLGPNGLTWTPDTARDHATILLGTVKAGGDPAGIAKSIRPETVAALCDLYVESAKAGEILNRRGLAKKASTQTTDAYRIEALIKPMLGKHRVADLTRADIESFMTKVAAGKVKPASRKAKPRGKSNARGGRGAATRTLGLLGAIVAYGVKLGLRSDNPVHGVQRFADGRKERRLTIAEYEALGAVLNDADIIGAMPYGVAITHLLAVTGWRRGEAVNLAWADIDLTRKTASLSDTKTGRSVRPLSRAACEILGGQANKGTFVFPARSVDGEGPTPTMGFPRQFAKLRKAAGLPADVTPHVLRHSYASAAADLGYSEATIGALLGHRTKSVTGRYTHAADAVLVSAADAVASEVQGLMFGMQSASIIDFQNRTTARHADV